MERHRSLVFFFTAILVLAIWTQKSISADIPNRFASWLYNFINDWAIALGAIVTFTLVIAAFLAILENRHSKVLDRKERWLNEILDWANDVQQIISSENPEAYTLKGKELISMLLNTCNNLRTRTKQMEIISEVFGEALTNAVVNTGSMLKSCQDAGSQLLLSDKPDSKQFIRLAVNAINSTSKVVELCVQHKIILLR